MSDLTHSELRFSPGGEGREKRAFPGKHSLREKLSQAAAPLPLSDPALLTNPHRLYHQTRLTAKPKAMQPRPPVRENSAPRSDFVVQASVMQAEAAPAKPQSAEAHNVSSPVKLLTVQSAFEELQMMRLRMIRRMKKLGFVIAGEKREPQETDVSTAGNHELPLSLNRKKIFLIMADMRMLVNDYEQVKQFSPDEAEDFVSVQKNYFNRIRNALDLDFRDIQKNCVALFPGGANPKNPALTTMLSRIHAHKALIASGEEYLKKIS